MRKNKGNSTKYKLRNVYARIMRTGNCKFESYEVFRDWSRANGYKPWKNLSTLVGDEYSPENCSWEINRRGSGSIDDISLNKTPDNVVANIREAAMTITEAKINLGRIGDTWESMVRNKLIDKKTGDDVRRAIGKCLIELNDAYWGIDNMDDEVIYREDKEDTDGK